MKKVRKFLIRWFFWVGFSPACSQQVKRPEINPDEFIQRLAATQQEDLDYENFYEALFQLYLDPLDLNTAEKEDLNNLFILSGPQIDGFLEYRRKAGRLISLYELQAVDTFDPDLIRNLLPFVTLKEKTGYGLKGVWKNAVNNYVMIRTERTLEQAKGYKEQRFAGSPYKIFTRYRLNRPGAYSFGFTSEKDAGEKDWLDYYSVHLQVQQKGKLDNLILGDYQAQFGQGLVFAGGFAPGKGGEPVYTTRRSDLGLRPYTSIVENSGMRGGAFTLKAGFFSSTFMYSDRKRDATVSNGDTEHEAVFSSLLTSGLHRTDSEMKGRRAIHERHAGSNFRFRNKRMLIGINLLYSDFGATFEKRSLPYNAFEFNGRQNFVTGIYASSNWQNFSFFGEAARSSSGGTGFVGGLAGALHPQWEWALHMRHYAKNFHSFLGGAFGENSRNINESGLYNGLKFTPRKGLVFSTYYDRFYFPWLKYLVDAPSSGHDYLFRISFQPKRRLLTYMQFHAGQKEKNMPENDAPTDFPVNVYRQSAMYTLDYTVAGGFRIQSRVQYNRFRYEGKTAEKGLAWIQDLEGNFRRIQFRARMAYFTTSSYDARIYAFENDVLSAVSFPAYYGKGWRYYLVWRFPAGKHVDFWLRAARSKVSDRESIGSGLDELSKPEKTDVKVQMRFRW